MNLRQKLLLLFSLTVAAAVAAVTWTVLVRIRLVFEQRDQQETALFVSQFQREFQHRSAEVAAAVDRIAASERVRAMAFELIQSRDASPYLTEAQTLAQDAQLDFLEIVGPDSKVISSAQWPARFGYPEPAAAAAQASFLKREDLPDGTTALGLFAVRAVRRNESGTSPGNESQVRLVGGKKLDQNFLADLSVPAGMQIYLYSDAGGNQDSDASQAPASIVSSPAPFDPKRLLGVSGEVAGAAKYQALIDSAQAGSHSQSAPGGPALAPVGLAAALDRGADQLE
jgi:two-component system nitrogen regulation sensor histidine kinase NtrY